MLRGHLAMLAFSGFVSVSFVLGSYAAPMIAPQAITVARFALAVLILAITVAWRGELRASFFQAPWRYLLPGGCFAIYFVLMFEALKTANPVNLAVIFTLTPLLSGSVDRVLNAQPFRGSTLVALVIGAIGAVWVIFDGQLDRLLAMDLGRGEWLFFLGVLAHAIYPAAMPWISRGEPSAVASLGALSAAGLITLAFGIGAVVETQWTTLPLLVWSTIAYLAIFATAASFFLVKYASTLLPSAKVMAYTYLVPVWVGIAMAALSNSWPTESTIFGGGLILIALLVLLMSNERSDHTSTAKMRSNT